MVVYKQIGIKKHVARRNGRYWKFKKDEINAGITFGTLGKEYRMFRMDEFLLTRDVLVSGVF